MLSNFCLPSGHQVTNLQLSIGKERCKAVGLTSTILSDLGKNEGEELTEKSSPTVMIVSIVVVLLVLIIVGAIAGGILWRR